MLRNPDKWIYAIERTAPMEDVQRTDYPFNLYGWKWSEGYDSVETIGKMYTRGEAVDMIFNRHYVFVRYLATQHLPWENGVVSFMKNTTLKREVLTLEDIWDKLLDKNDCCEECYGSCEQCVYRKVDTEIEDGKLVVKNIRCLYSTNKMMQDLAKGNQYCRYFTCLHLLSKHNTTRC